MCIKQISLFLYLAGALVTNKDMASFVGSVLLDDTDKYGLTAELKLSKTGNADTYIPFIELTGFGRTEKLLSGIINVDTPNKFDANLEVKGFNMLPYTVEGWLFSVADYLVQLVLFVTDYVWCTHMPLEVVLESAPFGGR